MNSIPPLNNLHEQVREQTDGMRKAVKKSSQVLHKTGWHLLRRRGGHSNQLVDAVEGLVDDARGHCRRLKHRPIAAMTVIAGSIAAFLLVRRLIHTHHDQEN